ncbi:hypothetical protein ACWEPL_61420 [Nonomuraea sp. NPDC004186]
MDQRPERPPRHRWRVRPKPTYDQGMAWAPLASAVERAEEPGRVLVVSSCGRITSAHGRTGGMAEESAP